MISVQDVTDGISKGRGTLGRLMNDPAAAKSLEASLDNLEAVTARIRAGEGSIGKLLNDDALSQSLTSMSSNLDAITGRINREREPPASWSVMTSSTTGSTRSRTASTR